MANRQPTRRKHVPVRTCIVCREARPKRELTRLVRAADQPLQMDPGGKLPGRGAYLCDKSECWHGAARGKALDAALRTELQDEDRALLLAHAHELETTKSSP